MFDGDAVPAARRSEIDYFFRTMFGMSLFEQMGGERELRKVVSRFVDRMFDDVMIGFMFRRASRERVKAMEYEFAARHLGGTAQYTGRPLSEAHAPHPINMGHFNRRLKILDETLTELGVPVHVRAHWVRVTDALRSQILSKSGPEACPTPETERAAPASSESAPAGNETAPAGPADGTGESGESDGSGGAVT